MDPHPGEEELNRFLASHRIVSIEKHCAVLGQAAYWSFAIAYLSEMENVSGSETRKRGSVDYKDVLNADDFAVFAQLRDLRNAMAKRDGKPPYAIFNNEQLAKMVTDRVKDKTGLAGIEGIGQARLEQYADKFLEILRNTAAGDEK
jgi:superfamily II DNA helicase RecQ